MSRSPKALPPWDLLVRDLAGSFTARARGLLASEFILLNSDDKEFGRLRLYGASGTELRSENLAATFEASGKRYRMVADGEEVLVAAPKGRTIDELVISCGGQTYEARVSFFRNRAVASYPDGERAARLSGSLMGRSYKARFAADDGCALPGAIFLLWHVATNRRRAYRTRGGAM